MAADSKNRSYGDAQTEVVIFYQKYESDEVLTTPHRSWFPKCRKSDPKNNINSHQYINQIVLYLHMYLTRRWISLKDLTIPI